MKKCPPHHWICEDVSGLTSRARCRKCRAVKEFNNYLPQVDTYRHYVTPDAPPAVLRHRSPRPSVTGLFYDSI